MNALKILEDRFGQKDIIIAKHMEALCNLEVSMMKTIFPNYVLCTTRLARIYGPSSP